MRPFFHALALVAALALPSVALADVIPPAGDCEGKTAGSACKDFDGKAGTCGTITYTKTFRPPFPDAAPMTSEQSYFGCKAGATPNGGATTDATTSTSAKKGCSVGRVGERSSSDGRLAVLALAGLVLVRRRRSR